MIIDDAQTCPQWVASLLADTMSQRPDYPGIQLALITPLYDLDFKTSISSKATHHSNQPPLLADTPWRIASITKTFTAVAALRLAEQGKLDLHAPIVDLLQAWAVNCLERQQGSSNARQITTWMLMQHTSGLAHHAGDPRFLKEMKANTNRRWTLQEILEWAADKLTSIDSPGDVFHYSDTGYTYLGLLIETITKEGLAAAVRKLTKLDELGMSDTYWEILEPSPNTPRPGQYLGSLDVTNWDASFDLYGAGGMVSTSEDLNRFTRALHAGQIINKQSLELMYTTESSGKYGCGILKTSFAGRETWGHTGFWGSWSYYVPSLDLVFSGTDNQGVGPMFDAELLVQAVVENCVPPDRDVVVAEEDEPSIS